ncbi:MAG: winged helix-turn-helix domain-containing protein [Woeseiaceae bacterium]
MRRVSLKLDARRRVVAVDGREAMLQERSWQVLTLLLARSPDVVSRREIVDAVWSGNSRTGEKGLNQAMWAIRAALGDDPRAPEFIRTIPRLGYQWVGCKLPGDASRATAASGLIRAIAGIGAVAVAVVAATYMSRSTSVSGAESASESPKMVATKAYLVDRDIHVEFAGGCLGILKNAGYADIGAPVLSSDGTEVAVTVREAGSCRLVTIGVADGERRDFENCPTIANL